MCRTTDQDISDALKSLTPKIVSSFEQFATSNDPCLLDNLLFLMEHSYRLVFALRDHYGDDYRDLATAEDQIASAITLLQVSDEHQGQCN